MVNKKIILLATDGFSTNVVYNALQQSAGIDTVIIEKKIDKKSIIKRRIKKLGWIRTAGQLLFQVLMVPLLNRQSKQRQAIIKDQFLLDDRAIPSSKIKNVDSINSEDTKKLLQQLNPDLVIVNGTRIISKNILTAVKTTFINTHAGITPKYRGVHGGYWALVNKDEANNGVTVHLVDAGIDTGGILYQARIAVTAKDNFISYPMLQLAAGVPLLKQAVNDIAENKMQIIAGTNESQLWYHPTLWQYCYNRLFKNVK